MASAGNEDPFVFQRPDGSVHCIYHAGPDSYHAYSADGKTWTAPSTVAYNVSLGVAASSQETTETSHCTTNSDCSLLGTCTAGKCSCAAGFTGAACGQLDLQPAASLGAATVWPQPGVPNSSAWGFSVAYDPDDKVYHAVADVSCGCDPSSTVRSCTEYTGVLASGGYASSLVHLTSDRPDGGFRFAGVIAPATSFNPQLIRSPSGEYVLYFRVNAVDPLPFCSGDPKGPASGADSMIKVCTTPTQENCIHGGDSERGTNMYAATAPSMDGPWTVAPVTVAGEGQLHISNPSIAFVRPGTPAAAFGSVVMAFRYNGPHGENNGIAYAYDPNGPFVAVANLTMTPGPPAVGVRGASVELTRRERPSIFFDPTTGAPVVLYNGGSWHTADGTYKAFSLAQRFAH